MGEIKRLSDAEHEIMNIIWEKGESMCVGDVFEYLSETDRKYTTVATFLTRLEKKGFLKCIKKDGKNYYECIADRDKYRREQTDDLINELYDGERSGLIACLCKGRISDDDYSELMSILKKYGE